MSQNKTKAEIQAEKAAFHATDAKLHVEEAAQEVKQDVK